MSGPGHRAGSVTVGSGGVLGLYYVNSSYGYVDDQGVVTVAAGGNVYDYGTFNVNGGTLKGDTSET